LETVNYVVYGPAKEAGKERVILEGEKERQGDFVFTANEVGEYRFCFDNTVSTFTDKVVDFEIAVENEARSQLPQRAGASPEQLSGVEETILKLSGQVSTLTRQQKYFRTRENRNFSTVRSTEKRIFNFSLMEVIMMVAMACLQVFIVRQFFTGGRKGEFSSARTRAMLLGRMLTICRICVSLVTVSSLSSSNAAIPDGHDGQPRVLCSPGLDI